MPARIQRGKMLEIRDLHASVEGKKILHGINLTVRHGEVLVVKAGERHRSRAEEESLVLIFKAAHLFAE